MAHPDQNAVERTRAGDQEAFGELADRYAGPLSALAYDRLGSVADAQDAVQETLLTAFQRLSSLREPERFGAWVYEILRNTCAMKVRGQVIDRKAVSALRERRSGDASLAPLDQAEAQERSELLRQAVAGLTPPLREIVVLRYLGGTPRQEAAAILGISLAAADKRLERALRELRTKLAP